MAGPAKSAFNFSGIGGQLRDPLSVYAGASDESFETGFVSEFSKAMDKARKAKAAKNKFAETESLKFLNQHIQEGIDTDMQDALLPQVKAVRDEWAQKNINNDISPQDAYKLETKMNQLVEQSQLGQVQAQALKASVALLQTDSDETDKQKFDHEESRKRLDAVKDPIDFIDKHPNDPFTKKVRADWDNVKNAPENKGLSDAMLRYKFRTEYQSSPEYSLQPAKDVFDLTKYMKGTKFATKTIQTSVNDPATQTIKNVDIIVPDDEKNTMSATVLYNMGKTARGNPIKDKLDEQYEKGIKDGSIDVNKYPDAQSYGVAQIKSEGEKNLPNVNKTDLKHYTVSTGEGRKQDLSNTDFTQEQITVGGKTYNYNGTNISPLVQKKGDNRFHFTGGTAFARKSGQPVDVPDGDFEIAKVGYTDDGKKYAIITQPADIPIAADGTVLTVNSNGDFVNPSTGEVTEPTKFVANKQQDEGFIVPYEKVQNVIKNRFAPIHEKMMNQGKTTAPTGKTTAPTGRKWTYKGQTFDEADWLNNGWTLEQLQKHAKQQ